MFHSSKFFLEKNEFFGQENCWYFWKMDSSSNTLNCFKILNFIIIGELSHPDPLPWVRDSALVAKCFAEPSSRLRNWVRKKVQREMMEFAVYFSWFVLPGDGAVQRRLSGAEFRLSLFVDSPHIFRYIKRFVLFLLSACGHKTIHFHWITIHYLILSVIILSDFPLVLLFHFPGVPTLLVIPLLFFSAWFVFIAHSRRPSLQFQ